jgi:hypothetical protein
VLELQSLPRHNRTQSRLPFRVTDPGTCCPYGETARRLKEPTPLHGVAKDQGVSGVGMSDGDNVVQFNRSAALIEMAKQEQRRLLQLIHESQATIERSRDIISRLEEVLWADPQR